MLPKTTICEVYEKEFTYLPKDYFGNLRTHCSQKCVRTTKNKYEQRKRIKNKIGCRNKWDG